MSELPLVNEGKQVRPTDPIPIGQCVSDTGRHCHELCHSYFYENHISHSPLVMNFLYYLDSLEILGVDYYVQICFLAV